MKPSQPNSPGKISTFGRHVNKSSSSSVCVWKSRKIVTGRHTSRRIFHRPYDCPGRQQRPHYAGSFGDGRRRRRIFTIFTHAASRRHQSFHDSLSTARFPRGSHGRTEVAAGNLFGKSKRPHGSTKIIGSRDRDRTGKREKRGVPILLCSFFYYSTTGSLKECDRFIRRNRANALFGKSDKLRDFEIDVSEIQDSCEWAHDMTREKLKLNLQYETPQILLRWVGTFAECGEGGSSKFKTGKE